MFLELRMSAEYLWLTHSALFNGEMHCSHPQGAATIFAANPFHSPRERDALQPPTMCAANPFCSLRERDALQPPSRNCRSSVFAANPSRSLIERDALQPPTIFAANPSRSLRE